MRMIVVLLVCCVAGGAFVVWSVLPAVRMQIESSTDAARSSEPRSGPRQPEMNPTDPSKIEITEQAGDESPEDRAVEDVVAARDETTSADAEDVKAESEVERAMPASEVHWAASRREETDWRAVLARQARLIAERPDDFDARFELAAVQMRLKLWTSALRELDRLAEMRPEDARVRVNRAQALRAAGRIGEARGEWDRVLALDPQSIAARAYRGEILLDLGSWAEAEADFRAVLSHQPGDDVAALNLALALQHLERTREALAVVEKLLADQPRHLAGLRRAASLAAELARTDETPGRAREAAVAYARRALAIDARDEAMRAIVARWGAG